MVIRGLPKRYLRYLSYFCLVVFPLAIIAVWYQEHHQSVGTWDFIGRHNRLTEEQRRESLNALKVRGLDNPFVTAIGTYTCIHLTRFLEVCPRHTYRVKVDTQAKHQRRIVKKDLNRSKGFRLFGISSYLSYDVIFAEDLLGHDLDKIFAVHSFSTAAADTNSTKNIPKVKAASISNLVHFQDSFITEIDVLFGNDCVEPRLDWTLSKDWKLKDENIPSFLTFKRPALEANHSDTLQLRVDSENNFKIVQLADLHFSVDEGRCRDEHPVHETCKADPKTSKFIERVLDLEKPQLVVFTGDQIMGDECRQDSLTALLKVVAPVIERKIPYAMVWGNHDDEGSLNRWELSELVKSFPYSLFKISEHDTQDNSFGVGNYMHYIYGKDGNPVSSLYFLDSHKYSPNAKAYPGYDWIKEEQWKYLETFEDSFSDQKRSLSMAFFHIPLPEYANFQSTQSPDYMNPSIGS